MGYTYEYVPKQTKLDGSLCWLVCLVPYTTCIQKVRSYVQQPSRLKRGVGCRVNCFYSSLHTLHQNRTNRQQVTNLYPNWQTFNHTR